MSTHPTKAHSFTVHYPQLVNVLHVKIQIAPAFDPSQTSTPHPPHKEFVAIWDTGATNSVITENVVNECGLKPIGMTKVHGVGGPEVSVVFLVNILLPNGVGFVGVRVTSGKLIGDANVLIGMDIINKGDLAITHNNGKNEPLPGLKAGVSGLLA